MTLSPFCEGSARWIRFPVSHFILFLALALAGAAPAHGQDVQVYLTASMKNVGASVPITYTVMVSNEALTAATGVVAQVQLPSIPSADGGISISSENLPQEFGDCVSSCSPGSTVTWTIGELASGQSVAVSFPLSIVSFSAQEPTATTTATVSADGQPDHSDTVDVTLNQNPLLHLHLGHESGPAVPGRSFTYVLTYGNVGSISPTATQIRMPLPSGTTFRSASAGGTLSGGVVTWDVGTLVTGAGNQVQVTVDVDNGLPAGRVLAVEAEIDSGFSTEPVVAASIATPVRAPDPLRVDYSVSQSTAGDGKRLLYTVTAANAGASMLEDVTVEIYHPLFPNAEFPETWTCERCTFLPQGKYNVWPVGTLAPGKQKTAVFTAEVFETRSDVVDGGILHSRLRARTPSQQGEVIAMQDVHIDSTPLLQLGLRPDPGPAVPGRPHGYTLFFGNVGTATPSGVSLRMPLPPETQFVSATGEATVSNGVVEWTLGALPAGTGGQVRLTVDVPAGATPGTLLKAQAEINPNDILESTVRSTAVVSVGTPSPLRLSYATNQTAFEPVPVRDTGSEITYALTVSNASGTEDLTDIVVDVVAPETIQRAYLEDGWQLRSPPDRYVWGINRLAPGESRTTFMRVEMTSPSTQDAGSLLRSTARATSTQGHTAFASPIVHLDTQQPLRLSLAPEQAPVAPGGRLTYALSLGNTGPDPLPDLVLRVPIPEGTQFVAASDGGTLQNGAVVWNVGVLGAGGAGQASLEVTVDGGLADGTLLQAAAEVYAQGNPHTIIRSEAVTPIRGSLPMTLTYTSDRTATQSGDEPAFTLTATNGSTGDLTDVTVRVLLPDEALLSEAGDLTCPFPPPVCFGGGCSNKRNVCFWTTRVLPGGTSAQTTFSLSPSGNTASGKLIRGFASATVTGFNQMLVQRDLLFAPADSPLPVEWAEFSGVLQGDAVLLTWRTASETGNAGFHVDRRTGVGPWTRLGRVASSDPGGTSSTPRSYRFQDASLPYAAETLTYRIRQTDLDGTVSYSKSITLRRAGVTALDLQAPFPNPAQSQATVRFAVPDGTEGARLILYDLLGRAVRSVDVSRANRQEITLPTGRLAPGVYVLRLTGGGQALTQRVTVVR